MKLLRIVGFLFPMLLLTSCATTQPITLLPGIVYYDGPEKLTGKLTFLLKHDDSKKEKPAAIYEFNLVTKKLKKVADAPGSYHFIPPDRGDLFCVVYGPFEPSGRWSTNAFIHSDSLGRERTIQLEEKPYLTGVSGSHVFFQFGNGTSGYELLEYDAARDELHPAETSDARWKKLQDAGFTFRAFDGRYIFFEGSGAPSEGFTLVSSPLDHFWTEQNDPKGKNVRVLHRFSVLRAFVGSGYYLNHLSPDGRYAVVAMEEPTAKKTESYDAWAHTYYAVDVISGKVRLLLKENVEHVSECSMTGVWWVGD